jgi:hypothetical protein
MPRIPDPIWGSPFPYHDGTWGINGTLWHFQSEQQAWAWIDAQPPIPAQPTGMVTDLHNIAQSLSQISAVLGVIAVQGATAAGEVVEQAEVANATLKQIRDCVCKVITGVVAEHDPSTKENVSMAKLKAMKATAPVTQGGDIVTINGTDSVGNILPLPSTVSLSAPVVSDPTVLTVGAVTGVTYPETFLTVGTVTVTSTATWSDGTDGPFTCVDTVTLTDTVTGLVATHSLAITKK